MDKYSLVIASVLGSLAVVVVYGAMGQPSGGFVDAVCQWDCGWYTEIATNGYTRTLGFRNYADWAFFPLFPIASRLTALFSGLHQPAAGILLNNLLVPLLAGVTATYGWRFRGMTNPGFAALVIILFPFGLYYRSGYSESVYGSCLIAALYLVRARRAAWGVIPVFLLATARPTGFLMAVILALFHAVGVRRVDGEPDDLAIRLIESAALIAAAVAGLSAYMVYLHWLTGDALAFSRIQNSWGRDLENPLHRLLSGLGKNDFGNFRSSTLSSQRYLAAAGLAGLVLSVAMAVVGWRVEAAMLLVTLLLALSTGLASLPRYMFCNPLSILFIAAMLERLPAPVRWSALALFAGAQILLLPLWYRHAAFLT